MLFDYIGKTLAGSVSFIQRPDAAQMIAYTKQVRRNSPYTPEQFQSASIPSDSVIPAKVGEACPIKYVLYIIKENRTYDQVFGDFRDAQGKPAGNGDSNLTIACMGKRHAQPSSTGARLCSAGQSVLQQRGER